MTKSILATGSYYTVEQSAGALLISTEHHKITSTYIQAQGSIYMMMGQPAPAELQLYALITCAPKAYTCNQHNKAYPLSLPPFPISLNYCILSKNPKR